MWHYEHADIEYGKMQSNELTKYLEQVCAGPPLVLVGAAAGWWVRAVRSHTVAFDRW